MGGNGPSASGGGGRGPSGGGKGLEALLADTGDPGMDSSFVE